MVGGSAGKGGCWPGELFISSTFTCTVNARSLWPALGSVTILALVLERVYPSLNLLAAGSGAN